MAEFIDDFPSVQSGHALAVLELTESIVTLTPSRYVLRLSYLNFTVHNRPITNLWGLKDLAGLLSQALVQ